MTATRRDLATWSWYLLRPLRLRSTRGPSSSRSFVKVVAACFLVWGGLSPLLLAQEQQRQERPRPEDKVDPRDAKLLAYLEQHGDRDELLTQIDPLIRQFSDSNFEKREEASRKLTLLGGAALPKLKAAQKSQDKELARRAKECVEQIEQQAREIGSPREIVHQLLRSHPPGTAEAVVRFLPHANSDAVEEDIYFGLEEMLREKTTVPSTLMGFLGDKDPARRAVAGLLIGKFGVEEQRAVVRKLLNDRNATVRLRVAQGLLAGNDAGGIAALIGLLETAPAPLAWQAEELLRYAGGADSPKAVVGRATEAERAACRAAWERWWKENSTRFDPERASKSSRRPRLVLVFEEPPPPPLRIPPKADDRIDPLEWKGRIWLCGCEGQPRCQPYTLEQFVKDPIQPRPDRLTANRSWRVGQLHLFRALGPQDDDEYKALIQKRQHEWLVRLPNGNRVGGVEAPRFVETTGCLHRLVERDATGKTVWEAAFENEFGALVVWPLVRVGFSPRLPDGFDLTTIPARLTALKSGDTLQRRLAIQCLRTVRHDEKTFKAVLEALEDREPRVRYGALKILETLADTSYLERHHAERSPDGPRASTAVQSLIRVLGDPDKEVREEAIFPLLGCGTTVTPAVLTAYEDARKRGEIDKSTRLIYFLINVGLAEPGVEDTLRHAFADRDPTIRATVSHNLLAVVRRVELTPKVRKFTPEFVKALEDPDAKVVEWTELGFSGLGTDGAAATPHFLRALKDPKRRLRAAHTLAAIAPGDPKVLPALLDVLNEEQDVRTTEVVIEAISDCAAGKKAREVVPVFQKFLKDERTDGGRGKTVRMMAIKCLGKSGAEARPAVPTLRAIALYKGDEYWDNEAAREALAALEQIDPDEADKTRKTITGTPKGWSTNYFQGFSYNVLGSSPAGTPEDSSWRTSSFTNAAAPLAGPGAITPTAYVTPT